MYWTFFSSLLLKGFYWWVQFSTSTIISIYRKYKNWLVIFLGEGTEDSHGFGLFVDQFYSSYSKHWCFFTKKLKWLQQICKFEEITENTLPMLGEIFKMYVLHNKKWLCIHIMTLLYKPLLPFLMNNIYKEQRIWHHKKAA